MENVYVCVCECDKIASDYDYHKFISFYVFVIIWDVEMWNIFKLSNYSSFIIHSHRIQDII